MKELPISSIQNIRIGQAEDRAAGTGCTVVLCERGAVAGADVRGGGPASRESQLLSPLANAGCIHAVLLSGGSAFGLDAAGGVLRYLEARGVGYDTGFARVPLVCQSALYDLGVGSAKVRPDADMAYAACVCAEEGNYRDGCYGAGTGATVGKLYGVDFCMKSGIGSYAVQLGDLQVGALAAVNAFGDISDWKTGERLAGTLNAEKTGLLGTAEELYRINAVMENKFTGNTTLGVILTNAAFTKAQMTKIAGMTHNGYARAIRPVHTSADGDTIYALSTGDVISDMDMVGTLAADVMAEAIARAVRSAESAYGRPAWRDLPR